MTIFAVERIKKIDDDYTKRSVYQELLSKRWNGKVKIITGIRRCGKSFLLFTLYKDHLLNEGVTKECFVELA